MKWVADIKIFEYYNNFHEVSLNSFKVCEVMNESGGDNNARMLQIFGLKISQYRTINE